MNESDDDAVWAYHGRAAGRSSVSSLVFATLTMLAGAVDPVIGSYEASGLDGDISFDRVGRYQAYGLDQFESMELEGLKTSTDVNWDNVRWGELQAQCVEDNHQRFRAFKRRPDNSVQYSNLNQNMADQGRTPRRPKQLSQATSSPSRGPRSWFVYGQALRGPRTQCSI